MASASNSINTRSPGGGSFTLSTSFTENRTEVGTNSSIITASATLSSATGGSAFSVTGAGTLYLYWHDNKTNSDRLLTSSVVTDVSSGYPAGILSQFDAEHKTDGTLSGYVKAVWTKNSSNQWVAASASVQTANTNLTDIARKAEIKSAPNFNDEENPTITYSNPAGNSVSSLQACISLSGSTDDIKYRNISKTGTSYTFNLTDAERDVLREATTTNSRNVIFHVKTVISGNTYYSTSTKTFTIINGNPTFEDFTYKDSNTEVTTVTGNNQVLVKGLSTLEVTISSVNKMIAKKKATAKNYTFAIDNINKSENYSANDLIVNVGNVMSPGTKKLSVRAYDSRNNSTLVEKNVVVYEYNAPIVNVDVSRLNNFENQTTLKVDGSISSLIINNQEKNDIDKVQYCYRESNGTWNNWTNINYTISDNKINCTDVILSLDNTKAFEFKVRFVDNLSTTVVNKSIDVGQAILLISSNKKTCYINGEEILMYDVVDEWED